MQKLFGSRSQAIQLTSDDEDDFGVGSNGISSGFSCVSCLPRFTIMGGHGTIRISEEDATLDDYLDPTTNTTIEPLLEEYSNQQTDSAFNGATLQDSQRFLTRNPFASSTTKSTSMSNLATQHSDENNIDNDGYQYDSSHEQQQQPQPFAGAFPRVDFFLQNDENDAEFLSDHRISAVVGDSSKLTSQLELFDTQKDNCSQSSVLNSQCGNDGHDNNSMEATMEPAQPFEIGNDWNEALDMDSTVNDTLQDQQKKIDTDTNEQQQQTQMDNADDNLTDIKTHANTTSSEFDSTTSSPANDNEQTTEDIVEEGKLSTDVSTEMTSASRNMDDLMEEMKSVKLSVGNDDDNNVDTSDQAEIILKDGTILNTDLDTTSLSTTTVHHSHIIKNIQLTDMTQNDTESIEVADQSDSIISINNSKPSLSSSPPSPMPTMSTENVTNSFPSTRLSPHLIPAQNVTDSTLSPAPTNITAHDQHLENNIGNKKLNITSNNREDTNKDDTTTSSNDINSTTQLAAEPKNGTNSSDGRRRSSVAAVAHSLLGDKLDDFTEKLAYIRKNIIMSLDDDDEETDDYYDEDVVKFKQQQQQHRQLRRSRSGSMQQEMRRQSFDPSISRFSGNVQQQQQRQLSRANTVDGPRTQHRRSNSLMDGANSFAKIFQQMGGQHDMETNHQRHFSPSSFFASLAGPDLPPPTSSSPTTVSQSSGSATATATPVTATTSPLPQRSSSMSASPFASSSQQHHQYPAVSRSATQHPTSRSYTHETSSLHNVNEEENIDEEDLFDFSKMIAMGKNVRNISEDLMGNGIRLFNDLSTRMKNANANRLAALEQSSASSTTQQRQQYQRQYSRQPQPQQEQDQGQEQQSSSMDQEFLLGDTYI